jgi:hypothetical protein
MFYQTLPDVTREKLFAAMRTIDARSQSYFNEAHKLTPRFGEIEIGGGRFEQQLKGDVLASYLRALRKGATPQESLTHAQNERTEYVKHWNKKRGNDYVVHRALDAEQSLIDWAHRLIVHSCA